MKAKLLFLLLLASAVLPLVSAADFTFPYQTDSIFSIACDVDGAPCPVTTSCNLSLRAPDNTLVLNAEPMSIQANGDAEYTIDGTNITEIGTYTARVSCAYGALTSTRTYSIEVNATGDDRGMGLFIILAIASILVIAVAIIAQNEYIGFLGGALFVVTGIYAMVYGIGDLANLYTRSIAFVSLGLGFLFLIAAGYKAAETGPVSFSSAE